MTTSLRISSALVRGREARFVCHMGVLSGKHPRNTMAAIAECFDAGAERIEIDIHSLDGPDYVVFHDRRFDDTTTIKGSLGRTSPEAVRGARYRGHAEHAPPLLSDVLRMARDAATEMQLDLKDWRPLGEDRLRALVELLEPIRERVIISTGQDWNLRRLHQIDPELPFGFDPGHYIDHAREGSPYFLPRNMGAYGYRDDHPMAIGRTEGTLDYLRERFAMLAMQAPGAREWFLSYLLVLQMLDDGFNVAEWLHERGVDANVWTPDFKGAESVKQLERLIEAGVDRITTNTVMSWRAALGA